MVRVLRSYLRGARLVSEKSARPLWETVDWADMPQTQRSWVAQAGLAEEALALTEQSPGGLNGAKIAGRAE